MNVKRVAFKKTAFKNMTLGLVVAAGISLAAGTALADEPTTMAPPIDGASVPLNTGATGVNASADTVFNWQEIPANQQVPLTRATFDQGGYQLYDTAGETIVVPFTSQNLYMMKFAQSPNGELYFENEGGFPVLYVPKGGFLENATVAGARWFPLGENFRPAEPVFVGIAPSYTEFVNLGWYPNTCFYGGYYGHTSFIEGGLFLPTAGLFFEIGGHPYYGWNAYHDYYFEHPGFYHVGYYNRDFYHFAGNHYREFAPDRHFGGYAAGYDRGFNHGFNNGYSRGSYGTHGGFAGQSGSGHLSGRTFRGGGGSGQGGHNNDTVSRNSYTVNNYGGQHFGGGSQGDSSRTFRGASNSGGQSPSSGRSFSSLNSGSGRSFGGGSFSGGSHRDGGQSSRAASNPGGGRSDGGGRGGDGGGRGGGGGRR